MKFEYVVSGIGHIIKNMNVFTDDPTVVEFVKKCFKVLQQDKENHTFSVLFNAYTEKRLGEKLHSIYKDDVKNLYADSGGLQMITRGHTVTEQLKTDVYDIQSRYSDIGMSFDEIPIVMMGERSEFSDIRGRYFDRSILKEKAEATGQNLLNQINYFLDNKSNCKPMMIIQGNDLESYQSWINYIVDIVGVDKMKYVYGISSGAAALGQGQLEDYKRIFILSQLQYPTELVFDHYHFLGVGAVKRVIPLVALKERFEGKIISYDSTTHALGPTMGTYYIDYYQKVFFQQKRQENFQYCVDNINKNAVLLGLDEIPIEHFRYRIAQPKDWNDWEHSSQENSYKILFTFFVSSVYNFMKYVNDVYKDENIFRWFLDDNGLLIQTIEYSKCRDYQDFTEWYNTYGKTINSLAVMSKKPETFEDLI